MKAGTTSLYGYLRGHPDVFMPDTKELNFFIAEKRWPKGIDWYESMFDDAGDAIARGEASPSYTMYPALAGVAGRAGQIVPEARLVYVVRHPIERLRSNYIHALSARVERRPIDQALLEDVRFVDTTRYAMQAEEWLEHFPREQLLIIANDDLRHRRAATVQRVLSFIGVDPSLAPADLSDEQNRGETKRQPRRTLAAIQRVPGYDAVRRRMPDRIKGTYSRAVTRTIAADATVMSADTEARVWELLLPDFARLAELMGPDAPAWVTGP
jgi:hypothetical protein